MSNEKETEMNNQIDYQAKALACNARLSGAAQHIPKKSYSIRQVENGWLVETNSGLGLGSYEMGKGAYVAATLAEACQIIISNQ